MTKTRIKITEHKDGTRIYTAQYKWFVYWEDFSKHGIAWRNAAKDFNFPVIGPCSGEQKLEFAQKVIDEHIKLLENERKSADAKKVVSVKYVKYP